MTDQVLWPMNFSIIDTSLYLVIKLGRWGDEHLVLPYDEAGPLLRALAIGSWYREGPWMDGTGRYAMVSTPIGDKRWTAEIKTGFEVNLLLNASDQKLRDMAQAEAEKARVEAAEPLQPPAEPEPNPYTGTPVNDDATS